MSDAAIRDRRAERYAGTRDEILRAAWELVRVDGLASLSMRELGARVGMRAQSLYVYFPSKHAIFDTMFGEANRELLRRLRGIERADDPRETLRRHYRVFLDFCVEEPVRAQLLFQRTIPGFAPTPESFAPALEVLESGRSCLRACGVSDPRALDAFTAIIGGIASQQLANDPGGDRWVRLADALIDMHLNHYATGSRKRTRRTGT